MFLLLGILIHIGWQRIKRADWDHVAESLYINDYEIDAGIDYTIDKLSKDYNLIEKK